MTQRPEHTGTPWKVATDYRHAQEGRADIVAWANQTVTLAKLPGPDGYTNAAYIVRAVNSHADLVAALEACVSALEAVTRDLDADLGSIDHEPDDTLAIARTALARAKGEA